MRLLIFELKKILLTKKFIAICLLIIAGITILFFRNYISQDFAHGQIAAEYNEYVNVHELRANYYESITENPSDDILGDLEQLEEQQELNETALETSNQLISQLDTSEWQERLQLENQYYQEVEEYKYANGDHPLTFEEINRSSALNTKLLDEDIAPQYANYSIATPNFMMQVMQIFITFTAIALILLIIADILTREFEEGSIHFLITQPIKRHTIVLNKFIGGVVIYAIVILLVTITPYTLGLIFGSTGTFSYPIVIENNGVIDFITIQHYLVTSTILISVFSLFCITLYLFYSLIFRQTLTALFAFMATILVGYLINTLSAGTFGAWVNPFQNMLPEQMILVQNSQEWSMAIPVTLVVIVVLHVVMIGKVRRLKIG
ncbi:ABC transporter permease [Alkalibacillus haloalkaliphilus]|uniref:ABC transporter permease n=1 Tax=Alkalibacillus haloalkaliphilus TaxID=94136 RepID=UPI0029362BDB|nr:ABC transporter permease subunit [Alkalibacillus haloalkaliphilus]MDV2581649.1 ABC transporter permease subunit [Alkalibacillus haloalkaliphilus]